MQRRRALCLLAHHAEQASDAAVCRYEGNARLMATVLDGAPVNSLLRPGALLPAALSPGPACAPG